MLVDRTGPVGIGGVNVSTIGSLFSGIGGLELGLEWAGLGRVTWQVEKDEYCRQILAKHWPDAVRHEDVRTVGAHNLSRVDVLCGGFPCQDISIAGKGAGLAGARSGLWSEYARIVGELRPGIVLVENVAALVVRGLDRVLCDLAALGYDALWFTLRASDVGAPHLRERLFIVAYPHGLRQPQPQGSVGELGRRALDGYEALGDADGQWGFDEQQCPTQSAETALQGRGSGNGSKQRATAQSRVGGGAYGLSRGLDGRWPAAQGEAQAAWEPPRVAKSESGRMKRLAALGNAVVPQVAYAVGLIAREIVRANCGTAARAVA
jgi:DNA (cytosine-5)-methyltransferase 1